MITLSPRNPEGHHLLARIERQQENYAEAINSLKRAVRLRADAVHLRAELAEVYKLAGGKPTGNRTVLAVLGTLVKISMISSHLSMR